MSDPWSSRVLRDLQGITLGKLVAALGESQMHRAIAGVFPEPPTHQPHDRHQHDHNPGD